MSLGAARRLAACLCLLAAAAPAQTAELGQATVAAFDEYIRAAEARVDKQARSSEFLWAAADANRLRRVRGGEIVTAKINPGGETRVPGGLIHDWIGSVFLPGATLERTLALARNYDHHKNIYKPEVVDSKILSHNGNDYTIHLRLLKKKVLTVVLDTEHEVRYLPLDRTRWQSRSRTTRIAEVENAGRADERALAPGRDHGFLWRLNSYWRFEEKDGGVYVECEAVSLTRSVPAGLGWLIEPIIRNLPAESLVNTLRSMRAALSA